MNIFSKSNYKTVKKSSYSEDFIFGKDESLKPKFTKIFGKNYSINIYYLKIKSPELNLEKEEVLDEDLLNYQVLTTSGKKGIIKEIFYASPTNKIIRAVVEKEILVPMSSPLVKIDVDKKEIIIDEILEM